MRSRLWLGFLAILAWSCTDEPLPEDHQPPTVPGESSGTVAVEEAPAEPQPEAPAEGDSRHPNQRDIVLRPLAGTMVPPWVYELGEPLDFVPEEALAALWSPPSYGPTDLLRFLPDRALLAVSMDVRSLVTEPVRGLWETSLRDASLGLTNSDIAMLRESFASFVSATERCAFAEFDLLSVLACKGDYSETGWRPDEIVERPGDVPAHLNMAFYRNGAFVVQDTYYIHPSGRGMMDITGGFHVWIAERALSMEPGVVLVGDRPLDTGPTLHLLEFGETRVWSNRFTDATERATLLELVGQRHEDEDGVAHLTVNGTLVYSSEDVARTTVENIWAATANAPAAPDSATANGFISSLNVSGPSMTFTMPNDILAWYWAYVHGERAVEELRRLQWREGPQSLARLQAGISEMFERGSPIPSVPMTPSVPPCFGRPNRDTSNWDGAFWQEIGFAPEATRFAFQVELRPEFEPERDRVRLYAQTRVDCRTVEVSRVAATAWIEDGGLSWEPTVVSFGSEVEPPEPDSPVDTQEEQEEATEEPILQEKPPEEE